MTSKYFGLLFISISMACVAPISRAGEGDVEINRSCNVNSCQVTYATPSGSQYTVTEPNPHHESSRVCSATGCYVVMCSPYTGCYIKYEDPTTFPSLPRNY